jgi:hypothetical protein
MSNKKLNVVIASTMLLLATAVIATPMKIANAQQQLSTRTNQSGINIDQQIAYLKFHYSGKRGKRYYPKDTGIGQTTSS